MRALIITAIVILVLAGAGTWLATGTAPSEAWQATAPQDLAPAQREQLAKADAARDALFARLQAALMAAMQDEGPAGAIAVCSEVAPELAAAVSNEYNLTIGRTSFRTRNPDNAPPDWARPYVAERREEPVYLEHPGTRHVAALLLIRTQAQCLTCHGPAENIQPAIREQLDALYPDDQATGFALDELRGYFHIVVPPDA